MTDQETDAVSEEDFPDEEVQSGTRRLIAVVVVIAFVAIVMRFSPFSGWLDDNGRWQEWAKDNLLVAGLAFVGISALMLLVGFPRLALFAFAGYVFDIWLGLILAMLGSLIGSFAAYILARWTGRDWVTQKFGHLRYFQRALHAEPTITSVAMLRLLPISNALMNAVLAISRVDGQTFLIGSALGFLPHGTVAVLVGAGFAEEGTLSTIGHIAIAALLILPLAFYKFRRRTTHKVS